MQIQQIKVSKLKPYKNNPRHNDQAVDKVLASIKEFGFKNPIIIDKNHEIVCGHTRLKAAIKLGMDEVPCLIADDLTPDQVKAFRIIENKSAEWAEWDIDLLNTEIENIDMDMSAFGIETDFSVVETVEDDYEPVIPETPKTQLGDIYKLGDHLLICGDATDLDVYSRLMNKEKADLVVTDPPYNVDYEGQTKDRLKIQNDNLPETEFENFLACSFSSMAYYLVNGGAFYVFHADSCGELFRKTVRENIGRIRQCLIWAKNQIVMGRQDYQWKHEPILYGWKDGAHYFINDRTQSTVIECKKPNRNAEHPTMKPIELLSILIKNSSKQNGIVLDAFGGSGSTMIACEQLKRKCRMVELDPRYCDVIIERYENFTGKKAELISRGAVNGK